MKYFITTLLLAFLLLSDAFAHDIEVDGIYYNIIGDQATVTFRGAYNSSFADEYFGDVIIPEIISYGEQTYNVVSIDNGAFYECDELTNVSIPNSITTIGKNAFYKCSSLTNISIPNSVITIGEHAFYDCNGLSYVTIPNSVTSIDNNPFLSCEQLNRIIVDRENPIYDSRENCNAIIETASGKLITGCYNTVIPLSVTTIGEKAFQGLRKLTSINIPNSVISIEENAFFACGLTSIVIPNSVISIGVDAFAHCPSLENITIGNSVKVIDSYAFNYCSQLTNIIIPSSVKKLGDHAFYIYPDKPMDITLCGNIETVGSNVFRTISNLYIASEVTNLPNFGISPSNIYCYSTVPPICYDNTFSSYAATLHVPGASVATYFTTNYWCNFANLIGDAVEPSTISLSQTTLIILIDEQQTLTATILPNNAYPTTLNWISTNPAIATVSNGIVTALTAGECDIIVSCVGKRDICHVVVKDPSKIIMLNQNDTCVLPNHIISLTPTSSPEVMANLAVTSSDPTVAAARVMNGKVQVVGIKEGTTTITVGSTDGSAIPATCLVTVYTEPGDLNCDGFTNINDVTQIIDYLLSGDDTNIKLENADVNGNGNVSIGDVTALIDKLLSGN